jgi:hypothetical protein
LFFRAHALGRAGSHLAPGEMEMPQSKEFAEGSRG